MNINRQIYPLTALLMVVLLFTVGRFGFFDILGLKRPIEILLLIPISIIGCLSIFIQPRQLLSPFILLPLSSLITQLSLNINILELTDLSVSLLVITIILSMGKHFSDLMLRYLIKIFTIFALLGIFEFIIMILYPPLAKQILLPYDQYSGSVVPVIENFYQLLGLADGTSYHLWGLSVTRLRSFTSEPSLLVGYFLVPGALALSFGGRYTFYGSICIIFSILSLAGSVFLALFFSISVFFLSFLKNKKLLVVLPLIVLLCFIWALNNYYSDLIGLSHKTAGGYDFLEKTNSANVRFSYIRDNLYVILASPFGLHQEIHQPLGLLLGSMARGGILGLTMTVVILFDIFSKLSKFIISTNGIFQKIGFCIIYGALTAGIIYLDNCFVQLYGLTLLLLLYNRLKQLI